MPRTMVSYQNNISFIEDVPLQRIWSKLFSQYGSEIYFTNIMNYALTFRIVFLHLLQSDMPRPWFDLKIILV